MMYHHRLALPRPNASSLDPLDTGPPRPLVLDVQIVDALIAGARVCTGSKPKSVQPVPTQAAAAAYVPSVA